MSTLPHTDELGTSSPENILIIAFKFPPLGGMRVKRMTMFAKYLARQGYRVHIITVNWRTQAPNTWLEETQHPNIVVHRVASCAPHNMLESGTRKWLGVLLRKAARAFKRLFYFVDEAQYWGGALLPYATRLIGTECITNVIATGAPFMSNYWAARLKARLPQIHLIQDFRDPWNDHLCAAYNPYFLFEWQKRFSEACERYALTHTDIVVAITDALKERFERKTNSSARFVTISNGFDSDRYRHLHLEPSRDKMRLVYIGNLFVGRDQALRVFLRTIEDLVNENPEFGRSFELVTYGGFPPDVRQEAESLIQRSVLQINGYVSPDRALQAAGNAFALLLVNAEIFPYLVSGKVYEYIALRRPIYALTTEGELSRLIRQGNLGVVALLSDPEEQKRGLLELFDLWKQDRAYTPSVSEAFRRQFQYDNLVEQLIACFKRGS
jgi:glycosyltransferase involved in cell wall biosynthesis